MEILDIIDANDHVIGQASRDDCHNNASLIHRAVHFTLVDPASRRVMISRRSLAKKHDPGKLCFLGEHVMLGEGYSDAAHRGAKEELQITVTEVKKAGEHVFSEATSTERVRLFLITLGANTQPIPDPDEIAALEWYTIEQMGALEVSEMTRFWIENVEWDKVFPAQNQH